MFSAQATPARRRQAAERVLVLHDISELRRADRMRRDFVANVSHELRTPLTAVRGYVEALSEEPNTDQRAKFLEVIERHTARMERLVRDLLRLARLDAQQETADLHPCDVESLLRSVVADLATSDRTEQSADEHRCGAQGLYRAARSHQAARRAAQSGGERRELLARGWTRGGGRARGGAARSRSPSLIRAPVFPSPIWRACSSGSTGWTSPHRATPAAPVSACRSCKHLVELHGGSVRAANRPAGGAMFTIVLPSQGVLNTKTWRDREILLESRGARQCGYRAIASPTISSISCEKVRPALRAAIASSARDASQGFGFTSMTDTVPSGFSRMSTRP